MAPPTRRPMRVALTVAMALLIAPALTFANHQFSDVPTAASYHDEVEALVGAGITSGCGTGTYCPTQAVTRGQMAQFMVRGLGVGAVGYGELLASETEEFYVATVQIHTGGLPGRTGYVTVDADLQVLDQSGFCPCGVIFSIEDIDPEGAFGPIGTMGTSPVVQGGSAASGSVSWVFEAPTGTDVEYGIWAAIFADAPALSGPDVTGIGGEPVLTASITAEYSPFGSTLVFEPGPLALDVPDWAGPSVDRPSGRRVQER